jgi:hypothetical protein
MMALVQAHVYDPHYRDLRLTDDLMNSGQRI